MRRHPAKSEPRSELRHKATMRRAARARHASMGGACGATALRCGWTVIVRRSERGPEPRRRVLIPARRTEVPAVVVDVAGRASQDFDREPGRRDVVRALVAIDAAARCAAEHRHPRCPPMPRLESRIAIAHMRQRKSAVSPAAVAIRSAVSSTGIATSGVCSRAMQGRYPAQKLQNQQAVGTLRAIHGNYGATTHCAEIGSKTEPTITPQPPLIRPRSALLRRGQGTAGPRRRLLPCARRGSHRRRRAAGPCRPLQRARRPCGATTRHRSRTGSRRWGANSVSQVAATVRVTWSCMRAADTCSPIGRPAGS